MSQTSDVIRKSIIRQSIAGHNCRSIYENLCVAFSGSNLTLQVKISFNLKNLTSHTELFELVDPPIKNHKNSF